MASRSRPIARVHLPFRLVETWSFRSSISVKPASYMGSKPKTRISTFDKNLNTCTKLFFFINIPCEREAHCLSRKSELGERLQIEDTSVYLAPDIVWMYGNVFWVILCMTVCFFRFLNVLESVCVWVSERQIEIINRNGVNVWQIAEQRLLQSTG